MNRPDKHSYLKTSGARQELVNQIVANQLLEKCSEPPKQILDPCCGPRGSRYFFSEKSEWVGVDYSYDFVSQHAPTSNVAVADCAHLPYSRSSFDAVMLVYALKNHVNMSRSIAEVVRVIRPDGVIAVCEPGFGLREISHGNVNIPTLSLPQNTRPYHQQTKINCAHFQRIFKLFSQEGATLDSISLFEVREFTDGQVRCSHPHSVEGGLDEMLTEYEQLRRNQNLANEFNEKIPRGITLRHILPLMLFRV